MKGSNRRKTLHSPVKNTKKRNASKFTIWKHKIEENHSHGVRGLSYKYVTTPNTRSYSEIRVLGQYTAARSQIPEVVVSLVRAEDALLH